MARISLYVKGQLSLGRLNFSQQQMYKLGEVGLAAIKQRLGDGLDARDMQREPLTPQYARLKKKWTNRAPKRDAKFGYERTEERGKYRPVPAERQLLHNLRLRVVSDTRFEAYNTTEGNIGTIRRLKRQAATGIKVRSLPFERPGAKSKARALNDLTKERRGQLFFAWSPRNKDQLMREARKIMATVIKRAAQEAR